MKKKNHFYLVEKCYITALDAQQVYRNYIVLCHLYILDVKIGTKIWENLRRDECDVCCGTYKHLQINLHSLASSYVHK